MPRLSNNAFEAFSELRVFRVFRGPLGLLPLMELDPFRVFRGPLGRWPVIGIPIPVHPGPFARRNPTPSRETTEAFR
jgi:hypothetical protein